MCINVLQCVQHTNIAACKSSIICINIYPIQDVSLNPSLEKIVTIPGNRLLMLHLLIFSVRHTGKVVKEVINMGSYNYLGFAENSGTCADAALESTQKYGVGVGSTRCEIGKGQRNYTFIT